MEWAEFTDWFGQENWQSMNSDARHKVILLKQRLEASEEPPNNAIQAELLPERPSETPKNQQPYGIELIR